MDIERFRGWRRPGPYPPGGVDVEPGETLDYISGHYRIFQYEKGHRFSTDDLLTAWYGTAWAPRAERCADLGSGIGSVAVVAAWRLPGARFCTTEAQEISVRLARKTIVYNGLADRVSIFEGDLRRDPLFPGEPPFDLVLGSPPYFPSGTASSASHPQAVGARIETRGSVADYSLAASRILAPGGMFAFVFPANETPRALGALAAASLVRLRSREVVFREGEAPRIALFAAFRAEDLPRSYVRILESAPVAEPPLVVRLRDGSFHPEYSAIRLSLGFPPWSEDEEP